MGEGRSVQLSSEVRDERQTSPVRRRAAGNMRDDVTIEVTARRFRDFTSSYLG